MGAAVVAHGDAAPVFESPEHVLDFMALFVESFVIFNESFTVAAGRNARLGALGAQ